MIFNIKSDKVKARMQRRLLRQQARLEVTFRRRVRALLNQQRHLIAQHVMHGIVDIDHTINSFRSALLRIFEEELMRTGATSLDRVEQSLAQTSKGMLALLEQKGMREEFWSAFLRWVRKYTAQKVVQVQETTKRTLRKVIEDGKSDGKSYGEIAKDITGAALSNINKIRAMRIARTEVHTVSAYATQTAVESTRLQGLVREWVAMADERVRSSHREAHGQLRGMEEPFEVAGESLRFPGDPRGSAANTINCRCVLLYHTDQRPDRLRARVQERAREQQELRRMENAW